MSAMPLSETALLPVIKFDDAVTAVQFNMLDAVASRVLDILVSTALLVLLAPLAAVLALAVRLDSLGPVLFRQQRVGRSGRSFTMYKLRSMRMNADERVHAQHVTSLIRAGQPLVKLQNDQRVTRVGRFLRATSLDELPQLLNVVRGDMSIVGPRPALGYEVELYDERQLRRLAVRPGITGLAQLRSRGDGTLHEYITHDLEYVERRSFWLDVSILARTLPCVVLGKGAA